jgi:membrane protease subunit HflC
MNKASIVFAVIVGLFITVFNSFYLLQEGRQAIVTEFGKPVGTPITTPGLKFKTPFINDVRFIDKRILNWDGSPNQIPTKDKKYIKVDTTARWQIIDALRFIQTVQNERGAKARLDTILDGHTRDVISGHRLVEAVRDSNDIIKVIEGKKQLIIDRKLKGESILEEEIAGEIEEIEVGREELSKIIVEKADKELVELGIKLIDVQLRRISYEESVEKKVYERMVSERQRIAQKIRSIGKGEKAKIEGRLQKDLKKIESEAYRKAQEIKGKAQGRAAFIYAKSLKLDPVFYDFVRSMEVYKKTLKDKSKFILSSESKLLRHL